MLKDSKKLDWLSKTICRVVAAVVGVCLIILIIWSIYYVRLIGQLTVLEINKAIEQVREKVEKHNRAIEQLQKFNKWQEQAK